MKNQQLFYFMHFKKDLSVKDFTQKNKTIEFSFY